MSYKLNKTDGTVLLDLIDGVQNTTATDLTLIGRNSTGFGEAVNENFIRLLENFAATSAPAAPIEGQLWFDTTTDSLKVYDGLDFKNAGGAYIQASQPIMAQGDLWYNTLTKQMYTSDGVDFQLIGPLYTTTQGVTGEIPDTITDIQGFPRSVIKHYVGGNLLGLWSNLEFKIAATNSDDFIEGLETDVNNNRLVKRGFNILDTSYKIHGTVTNANGIGGVDVNKIVRTDITSTIDASLIIRGADGLKFSSVHQMKYEPTNFSHKNLVLNDDYSIQVKGSASGPNLVDAIRIDASEARVGIYNSLPQATLHVGSALASGDVIIEGNLTVKGTNSYIEATTLRVGDKNIELGISEDSTIGDNSAINGAGIIVASTAGSKDILYDSGSESWNSNLDWNLVDGKEFKINGTTVLSQNALGAGITSAPGLSSLGTLSSFGTNFLTITGSTITTTSGQNLNLSAEGDVVVNSSIVRGLANGSTIDSAATKGYVDLESKGSDIAFEMDATGLSNTEIAGYIKQLYPDNKSGRTCRVLATEYTFTATTGVEAAKTIQTVSVDRNAQLEFESVVKNVTFADATTNITRTINRAVKEFSWDGINWIFQS